MSYKSLKLFGPPTTKCFCEIKRKPSFNGQYFQTSRISDIWFNENAWYVQNLICQEHIQFVKKVGLRLTGRRKCYFLLFAFSQRPSIVNFEHVITGWVVGPSKLRNRAFLRKWSKWNLVNGIVFRCLRANKTVGCSEYSIRFA